MPNAPPSTRSVVESHLQAFFRKSVDAVLQDYTEHSTLMVPDGTLHGVRDIRRFFEGLIGCLPPGFLEAFELHREEFEGDLAYIAWEASPWVRLGTDTFVVSGGKILMQTFASYPPLSFGLQDRSRTAADSSAEAIR